MADGYVSQVQLPNNETYNIRDKELIPRLRATVGHSNKNLLNLKNIKGKSEYGITWTIDEQEGIVTATGTVQTGKTAQLGFVFENIPSGNYYFYGCIDGSDATYDVYCWDYTTSSHPKQWDGTTNVYSDYNLVPRQLKIVDNHEIGITLRIKPGVTVNNIIFKPMVWDGNILDDTFEPYQEPTDSLIETKTRAYLSSTVGHVCKNLLDLTKYKASTGVTDIIIDPETGSVSANASGSWSTIYFTNEDIKFENGKTYVISCTNNTINASGRLTVRKRVINRIYKSANFNTLGTKSIIFTPNTTDFPGGWTISLFITDESGTAGSIDISDLMLREVSISDDTFEPYQIPTDERFKDYLPLSGGTLTGQLFMSGNRLSLKGTNIDSNGENPSSNTWSNSELDFVDKDNTRISFLNVQEKTDGSIRLELAAQNNNHYNTIDLIIDKDGNRSYSVSDPEAFRTAIGAGTSSTDNKTQQTINNDNKDYPLLFSYAEEDNTTTDITNISYRNNDFFINPSSGYIYSKKGFCAGPFKTAAAGKRVWINQDGITADNYLDGYSIKPYERMIIKAWAGKHTSNTGLLLTVDSGGLTMIGGGESSTNLANLIDNDQTITSPKRLDVNNSQDATGKETTALTGDSEQLILSSDNHIYFITGCQTLANRQGICLNANRTFYPMTDNSGKIGSSSFRWQYGYFGQVYGTGSAGTWKSARDNASFIKDTDFNGANNYAPIIDLKTTNGDWSMGVLRDAEYLIFSYVMDSTYSGSDNKARKYVLEAPSTSDDNIYHILHTGNLQTYTIPNVTSVGTLPSLVIKDTSFYPVKSTTTTASKIVSKDITIYPVTSSTTTASKVVGKDITFYPVTSSTTTATKVTLGTSISADDITSWDAGTLPSFTVSKGVLTLDSGSLPSLSYTSRSIPNVTGNTNVTVPILSSSVTVKGISTNTDVTVPILSSSVTIKEISTNTDVAVPILSSSVTISGVSTWSAGTLPSLDTAISVVGLSST